MPRWLSHTLRILVTVLPLLVGLLHAVGVWRLESLERAEATAYDLRLRALMPSRADERIVIVDIDEQSLAEVGRWPWSRDRLVKLVDTLFEDQQIAVMGMDVVFAEPDTSSGLGTLQALAQGPLRGQAGFAEQIKALAPKLDYDARFAESLMAKPVVLGYYFTSDREGRKSGALPEPVIDAKVSAQRRFVASDWNGYGSNIEPLAQAAPLAGFFNPTVDADGVVRSVPLLARHNGAHYESLALALLRVLQGEPRVRPVFPPDAGSDYPFLSALRLGEGPKAIEIAVDERVNVLVPYRGRGGPAGGSFTYLSAADVIGGKLPPGLLKDKIVLLGTTAPGLQDLRSTPVDAVYPGVEIHANVLSGLLDGRMPVRPDYAVGFELVVLLLSAVVLAWALPKLNPLKATLLSVAWLTAVIGVNLWLYQSAALVLPLAVPVLAVGLSASLNMAYGYFVESRSKRALSGLFGSYVPPELVDVMLKDPERYGMQAQDKELTVMFSDMRGFTNLSETMQPAQLQALLNRVFSRLTEEIRHRKGTIDKYMGDCVMAFWGAPVDLPNHAALAVESALVMGRAVDEINAELTRQGTPNIGMGVGLNTGTMCVGDMGSDLRRSYTVIGDAVNLGSRLEGVSKFYGVNLVLSESTRAQAGDGFIWQELDKVKVKGKAEAVVIHTAWGTDAEWTPALRSEIAAWNAFLERWRAQQWAEALPMIEALHQAHPNKHLYALYLERVQQRQGRPVDPSWDGSTAFETK